MLSSEVDLEEVPVDNALTNVLNDDTKQDEILGYNIDRF